MSSDSRFQLLQARARHMRHHPTEGERAFFAAVRGRLNLGVVVKRQVVIGRWIVDFLIPSARLIVEIDGGYHGRRSTADGRRDEGLARLGYRILRIGDDVVRKDVGAAVEAVRRAL